MTVGVREWRSGIRWKQPPPRRSTRSRRFRRVRHAPAKFAGWKAGDSVRHGTGCDAAHLIPVELHHEVRVGRGREVKLHAVDRRLPAVRRVDLPDQNATAVPTQPPDRVGLSLYPAAPSSERTQQSIAGTCKPLTTTEKTRSCVGLSSVTLTPLSWSATNRGLKKSRSEQKICS